jgi:hypothetical protein
MHLFLCHTVDLSVKDNAGASFLDIAPIYMLEEALYFLADQASPLCPTHLVNVSHLLNTIPLTTELLEKTKQILYHRDHPDLLTMVENCF